MTRAILAVVLLLSGCFTAHPAYWIVIENASDTDYVAVLENGLSRWGYAVPARTRSEIPTDTWNEGITVELRTDDCGLINAFPLPEAGQYVMTVSAVGDASFGLAPDTTRGAIRAQIEQCTRLDLLPPV